MRNTIRVSALVVGVLFASPAARADALDGLEGWLVKAEKLVKDTEQHYDGTRVLPGENSVTKLMRLSDDIKFALKYVTREYKGAPAAARNSDRGKALLARARAVITFVDALDANVKAHEERQRGAKKMCWAFRQQVVFGKEYKALKNDMSSLVRVYARPQEILPRQNYTPEGIKRYLEVAATFAEVCGTDAWKGVAELCTPDQANWCIVAADPKPVLKRAIDNYLGGATDKVQKHEMRRIGATMKDDGWIVLEGPVTWKSHMFPAAGAVEAEKEGDAAMYALVEADAGGELGGKAAQKEAAMAELRAKVEEKAPTWTLPPAGKSHYGVDLAKKAVKRWHKQAKIVKAFARNEGWTVYKDARDIPEYRDHGGYVLFQLPGEKWCQLRFFRITEQYVGGKPKKAKEAVIGGVRFQACK